MRRFIVLAFALVGLAACAPTGGLVVTENARPIGGNLFLEPTSDGGSFLVLDGEITAETSFVFQAMAAAHDLPGLVIAQSPGGDLLAGQEIGRSIKRKGMNTLVVAACNSACVDIFVAGKKREMIEGSQLGLHSATNRDVSYNLSRDYWTEMGFPIVNEKAYMIPSDRLWIMDAERARELRLATNILR